MNLDADWSAANYILHIAKLRNGRCVIYHMYADCFAISFFRSERLMIIRESLSTIDGRHNLP